MTGNDVILEALLLDGVIYPQQTISPEAQATSLLGLNNLLSEWNAQGMAIFSVVLNSYNLFNGVGQYTLGPGGSLASTRPEKVEAWGVHPNAGAAGRDAGKPVDSATFERSRAQIDREAQELGLLNGALTASRVKVLNYDAAFPLATITMYPAPSAGLVLDLWTWEQLTQITDPTLALSFPPGYLKAITYCLARDLAPKFGREVPQTVEAVAEACQKTLASLNVSQQTPPPAAPAQQQ